MLYVTVYAQLVLLQAVARLECEFALGAWVRSHPGVVHEVPANNFAASKTTKGALKFSFLRIGKMLEMQPQQSAVRRAHSYCNSRGMLKAYSPQKYVCLKNPKVSMSVKFLKSVLLFF